MRPPHGAAIVRANELLRAALGRAPVATVALLCRASVLSVRGCAGGAWQRIQPVGFALGRSVGAVACACRQRDVPQQSRDRCGLHVCFVGGLRVVTLTEQRCVPAQTT